MLAPLRSTRTFGEPESPRSLDRSLQIASRKSKSALVRFESQRRLEEVSIGFDASWLRVRKTSFRWFPAGAQYLAQAIAGSRHQRRVNLASPDDAGRMDRIPEIDDAGALQKERASALAVEVPLGHKCSQCTAERCRQTQGGRSNVVNRPAMPT